MSHSILIADDYAEMRQLVVAALETQGYQIRQATDTQSLLDEVAAATPDLLIMDLNMPGAGGIAALKGMRQDRDLDRMRVVVVSGSVEVAPEWLTEMGADAHLPKPFLVDDLNATVRRLLSG